MIAFVCGLSKSGKSSMIASLAKAMPNILHLKASEILSKAGRPLYGLSRLEALENQRVFAELARKEVERETRSILIDGHLLIETLDGPLLLPDDCLDDLKIDAILMITSSNNSIVARRQSTPMEASLEEVANAAELEARHAEALAKRRQTELIRVPSGDLAGFQTAVEELVRNKK